MKHLKWYAPIFIVSLMLTSCVVDLDDDRGIFGRCVDGDGPIVTRTINLPTIEGVDLELPAKVYISQGDEQSIVIEGKENIIDELELDVRDQIWEIDSDRCLRDIDELNIFITLESIRYLKISGSGEIVSEDFLNTDDIELYISGSGDMDLGLRSDDIDSRISGSGTIILEGSADTLDFEISGSGDYRAFDLESRRAFIKISGSGDAEVFVQDELVVEIRGSGDVIYRGNPTVEAQISGSGRVEPN